MKYFEEETKDIYELSQGRVVYGSRFTNIQNHKKESLAHHLGIEDLLVNRYAQYPNLWHTHAMVALQAQEFGLLLYIMSETWEAGYDRMYTSGKRLRDWAKSNGGYGINMIPSASVGFRAWLDPLAVCGAIEYIIHSKTNRPYTEIRIGRGTFLAENFYKANEARGIHPKKKDQIDPDGFVNMYNPKRKKVFTSKEILEGILGNNYAKRTGLFANSEDTPNEETSHSGDTETSHSGDTETSHSGDTNSTEESPTGGNLPRKKIKENKRREEEEGNAKAFNSEDMASNEEATDRQITSFVNILRSKYSGLLIPIGELHYYFDKVGHLRESSTDDKVVSGLAINLYKRMYKIESSLLTWLENKKQNQDRAS